MPSSAVKAEDERAGNGSYLNEFGRGEDGLVGHGGGSYYDGGVVLLLQPLIEHLHVEKTQEAKSATRQRGPQVQSGSRLSGIFLNNLNGYS